MDVSLWDGLLLICITAFSRILFLNNLETSYLRIKCLLLKLCLVPTRQLGLLKVDATYFRYKDTPIEKKNYTE